MYFLYSSVVSLHWSILHLLTYTASFLGWHSNPFDEDKIDQAEFLYKFLSSCHTISKWFGQLIRHVMLCATASAVLHLCYLQDSCMCACMCMCMQTSLYLCNVYMCACMCVCMQTSLYLCNVYMAQLWHWIAHLAHVDKLKFKSSA